MRLYVWQGDNVLENYGTGMVVVAANTAREAWVKLRLNHPQVWFRLTFGLVTMYPDDLSRAVEALDDDDLREARDKGFPVQPTVYDPSDLPVLVMNGSN